jgi:hypothetical protein
MPLGGRARCVAVTAAATAYACRAKSRSDADAHLKRTRDEQENYAENLDAMAKKLSEADELLPIIIGSIAGNSIRHSGHRPRITYWPL